MKKSFAKSNGQIVEIKKSLKKSNGQILKSKVISEIKRTNFGNQKNRVRKQRDSQRITTNNYFSDTPRTP